MPLPELLVDALATHRIVRLVQRDTVTARPRMAAVERLGDDHPLVDLLVCSWCASVHVAALTQLARALAPRIWSRVAAVLAVASAASLVADAETR